MIYLWNIPKFTPMKISVLVFIVLLIGISCQRKSNEKVAIQTDESGKTPFDYVNPFIGTGGEGHTYPGATVPFGMVQLSPDTDIKHFRKSFPWCAGYQFGDSSIVGFSHTHFSGTGHSDMGDILIMPTTGPLLLDPGPKDAHDQGYRSRFSHENEQAVPGFYAVTLDDYDIDVELTATTRCGFHKYVFNQGEDAHIILDLVSGIYNYDDKVTWAQIRVENDTLVTGMRQTRGWAVDRYLFFAIRFSKPIQSYGLVNEEGNIEYKGFGPREQHLKNYPEINGKKLKAYFNFKPQVGKSIMVKTGISAVDVRGALNNLDTEIPHWDFALIRDEAKKAWEKELNKVVIDAPEKEKEIFYTSVYHTFLSPVIYFDADRKYRGLDNSTHTASDFDNYTIYSLWDTYRALHPWFTISQPERTNDMIRSMLEHRQQSVHGILPVWSFHANETWCMIGYHAVSVIADAYLKGIRKYDVEKAFQAAKSSATYGLYDGLDQYMKYGFVPIDLENEGASKTLEYAYDDWTIAQMAIALGKDAEYSSFIKRAENYKHIFEDASLFMRARNSDGSFRKPFEPLYAQYGGDYTEGNAWQYSWYVPHDVQGLIDLMGGEELFVKRLDSLFVIEGDEEKLGDVEDIAGLIGQYAHGNEPSQHIAYLYNYAGKPWKTQERIHQIMNNLFDNSPYGICGNEDCGQMSAWYIFSSMGFYPVCPGSLEYVIGSPCITAATLNLENGNVFKMKAIDLDEENIYIQSATLNGNLLDRSFIRHEEIMSGGELIFMMGAMPNKQWATGEGARPYSMSWSK